MVVLRGAYDKNQIFFLVVVEGKCFNPPPQTSPNGKFIHFIYFVALCPNLNAK